MGGLCSPWSGSAGSFRSGAEGAEDPVAGPRIHHLHRACGPTVKRAKATVLVQKAMGLGDLATTMGYTQLLDDDPLAPVSAGSA